MSKKDHLIGILWALGFGLLWLVLMLVGANGQQPSRSSWVNGRAHAGETLDCDLPEALHMANIGSKVDGKGMCVNTSVEMSARWAGLHQYQGFRDWTAREPGGGWPERLVGQIAAWERTKGISPANYVQYEGPDPGPLIEAALKSGRMASITYGWSPRYVEGKIAHMVCAVKYSGRYACVLDNNHPGESKYEWMETAELIRRCKYFNGTGWVFVWLSPPPPPSPRN
jgi:hypothetical protein